jgi:hypothetical protein
MMTRRLPWLACLAIILAELARASAQTILLDDDTFDEKLSRSHLIDEKFGLPTGSAEELFFQRLKTIHTKEIGEGVGKKMQREELDRLSQNRDFVKDFLQQFEIKQLPAELRKKFAGREDDIEKFIRSMNADDFLKYAREAQGLAPLPKEGGVQPATDPPTTSPPTTAEREPESGSPPANESRTQEGTVTETSSSDQPANSVLGRWLLQAADRFKDLDPSLRNSPALRRLVRELSHKMDGTDERWKQLDKGANAIADKFARLGKALPLDRLLPEHGFSWPRGLTGESLPKWHMPETGPPSGPLPPSNSPWSSMPDLTGESGWRALWMLAILTTLGLVLWKTVGRGPAPGDDAAYAWKLRPWPVHPTAVQTREQLIQAFEYLSVLRLGPAARNWHHWAIASGLGRSSGGAVSGHSWGDGPSERLRAAEQLASLYERARYAPLAEPLPEATLAMARRDLCLLAGVPLS